MEKPTTITRFASRYWARWRRAQSAEHGSAAVDVRGQARRSARLKFAAVALVLAWATWLRVADLGHQSFWLDESVIVSQAQGILEYGVPRMRNGVTEWNSSTATYATALGMATGLDMHVAARLPAALAGVFCVLLTFAIAWRLTHDFWSSIAGAALATLAHDQIAWSRQAEPYIYLQLYLLAATWLVALYVETKKARWCILAILAAALCVGTHAAGYIAALIVGLTLVFNTLIGALSRLQQRNRPPLQVKTRTPFSWRSRRVLRPTLIALSAIALLILGIKLPAGHSNLAAAFSHLKNPYGTNYTAMYGSYLLHSLGSVALILAAFGVVWAVRRGRGPGASLFLGALTYYLLITRVIWTFAERYAIPLHGILIVFAGLGIHVLAECASRFIGASYRRCGRGLVAIGLFAATCATMPVVALPQSSYWLGITAPQPDWRSAFRLVQNREAAQSREGETLNVVSPYPILHDLYLSGTRTRNYYLPISFGGHPDGVSWTAGHTSAEAIQNLESLKALRGYLLLDDMALRMIGDREIADFTRSTPPDAAVQDRFNVFIWILPGQVREQERPDRP